MLECRDLRKSFGELKAVDGLSFRIAAGETYGLLGPNGAGKTTSISMAVGLMEREGGEVLLDGASLSPGTTKLKAKIGLVPQDLAIYPDLTARENLRFFGRLYDMPRAALRSRVDEVLEIIGLSDRADDRADTFSGGMKRRLNIGIGLLHAPRLLVLDEPTVGVDPQSRNAILESIERLGSEGLAVLYTTHYMEEAERLCDRIGIIDRGQIKAEGTRRELAQIVSQHDRVRLSATGPLQAGAEALGRIAGVQQVDVADGTIDVLVEQAGNTLMALLSALNDAGVSITGVEIDEPNLEAVFLHLTGRSLRD